MLCFYNNDVFMTRSHTDCSLRFDELTTDARSTQVLQYPTDQRQNKFSLRGPIIEFWWVSRSGWVVNAIQPAARWLAKDCKHALIHDTAASPARVAHTLGI